MEMNQFQAKDVLETKEGRYSIFRLDKLEKQGFTQISHLPYSIRILLESILRQCNGKEIFPEDVVNLAGWIPNPQFRHTWPFRPARVIMQDFTGVPAIVELAAMRSAVARLGRDPRMINPMIPVDLVIDHSVQVDFFAFPDTLVGTDSHTTMINGLGVVGWGVGGIEAEAAMLGQAIDMLTPDVIGVKLLGHLSEGITATALTLYVTQMLRNKG